MSPGIGRIITPAVVRESFSPLPTPERFKAEFPFALTVRPSQIRATAEEAALMTPAAAELQHGYHSLQMPVVILAGADDAIVDMQDHSARLRRDILRSQLWWSRALGICCTTPPPTWSRTQSTASPRSLGDFSRFRSLLA